MKKGKNVKPFIQIGKHKVGRGYPAYIIAEIGSNFDGSLKRAKYMVDLAVGVGANAAKFQSFKTKTIINKEAFKTSLSFQANWDKPVWDVYREAEFPFEWHKEISDYCASVGIDFMSSPYDREAVDLLERLNVVAYKIGSGEITNLEFLEFVASKNCPIILGCGACDLDEINEAVKVMGRTGNDNLILLQCITMYPSPFEQANIKAMETLRNTFDCQAGYSDHTAGSVVPLGSIALGACVIEKHFTDDKRRKGPDHSFAMNIDDFKNMVDSIRILESALGSPDKKVESCESETRILQRRSLFASRDIPKGTKIKDGMINVLRPQKGLLPKYKKEVIGRVTKQDIKSGDPITWGKI